MKQETVLITAPSIDAQATRILQNRGTKIINLALTSTEEEVLEILKKESVVGIISRTVRLTARCLKAATELKVICKHGAGYDNIDIEAATRRGIPVLVTGGANARSVAELAIGLMIAVARHLPLHHRNVVNGLWDRATFTGLELTGKNLGLIGLGAIGREVSEIAKKGLGMAVKAYDTYLPMDQYPAGVQKVDSLDSLLDDSDVLSIHCPLTENSAKLLGSREMGLVKKGAILINTARAAILDEQALYTALSDGTLAGAGLDDLSVTREPVASPLLSMPNVVITPHVGATTSDAAARVAMMAVTNLITILDGKRPDLRNVINPEVFNH